uniref:Putative capsid protein n=1 Tax=viral metagenome TaxID=1070528 RepID=A0A6M3KF00_9ZZZZ
MPRGIADIPELRLEVLQGFVTKFTMDPNLILMNLFPSSNSPSSSVKWESQEGSRGMTPFVPPGAPAPRTAPLGVAQHSAEAAYWKEKMYYDEEFLNNLRKEGTDGEYMDATTRLSRDMAGIVNRSNRRKEWMFAQMMFNGSFDYSVKDGVKATVDYSIRDDHVVSLLAPAKWSTGTNRDILGDIIDAKKKIADDCGGMVDFAICNSTVLKYIARDPDLLTLLQKTTFGQGDLFKGTRNTIVGVNPQVLGSLLDIANFMIYDEKYEVRAYLTAAVTASSTTTVYVEDASDYVAGGTLKFVDTSEDSFEEETIASVDVQAGTVTVSTAPSTSYKAGEDYVSMIRGFVPDTKLCMFASKVENSAIAEYKRAPFGLGRTYGMFTDRHENWDPDGVFIRVQDKGLPILMQRDGLYTLTVA